MTYRISFWRPHAGALLLAALIAGAPAANAQPTAQQEARIAAGMEEAVKAMDQIPRLKKLSLPVRRQLVEFITGNTLFVLTHEMGHGLINEMNLPVLGREEDAADSFAIVTTIKIGSDLSEQIVVRAVNHAIQLFT